jgi:uncharacterized protein YdbL (DUF1318 family)
MSYLYRLGIVFFFAVLTASPGWAIDLDEAKSKGFLGEKIDGYLGLVNPNAPAGVQSLQADINQKRRQTYEGIARRNNTGLDAVEALAGETAIKNTKPGNFVEVPSGGWKRK